MNETNREIIEISIDDIIPNRFQPRLTFDMEALNELGNSIKEHGIIQPLVVRKLEDKYEIIAGERRYKAASLIGMKKVPCIIMNLNDNESAEVAVIENIQRKEMSPLEEAKSFKKILDKGYLTQDELAKRMGKSQSSIANKLRLLNLDEVVQDAILNGKISERHARSLLKIDSKQEQRNVLNEILEKRLTVRQTDDLIKEKYSDRVDDMQNNSIDDIFKIPKVEKKVEEKEIYPSMPEVNMPKGIDLNPQINLINNVNKPNYTDENNNSNDIFKQNNNFEQNMNSKKTQTTESNIENLINPSVLSEPKEEKSNDSNNLASDIFSVDINSIKNNAQDIIQKEEKSNNISNLLTSEKPENKFFVDLNLSEEALNPSSLPFKVQSAVDSINRKIDEIKIQGTKINKEEKDLGNTYEIIIKIEK